MKKLLLSAVLCSAGVLAGQATITFQYQGETLANGAEITYTGYEALPGLTAGTWEYVLDPKIFVVSDEATTITIQINSNEPVQFCAGGTCTPASLTPSKNDVQLKAGVPVNLLLEYLTDAGDGSEGVDIPPIELLISAYPNSNPTVRTTVWVKMGGFLAGVDSLEADMNSVALKGKSLVYNLTGVSQLSVYSLSGKIVANESVSGNGSLDLSALPSGVYLYKLAGKKGASGKLVLK